MSKMSQLHAILSEQAYEMGYISLEQALDDGWEVDYERGKLFKGVNALELAHREWLNKRKEVLRRLNNLYDELVYIGIDDEYLETVGDTIEFIKQGEV